MAAGAALATGQVLKMILKQVANVGAGALQGAANAKGVGPAQAAQPGAAQTTAQMAGQLGQQAGGAVRTLVESQKNKPDSADRTAAAEATGPKRASDISSMDDEAFEKYLSRMQQSPLE